ncbi:MAG: hypothetical protein A2046_03860 [Bacteroidetes bacterium GWA2_30_7]|nr:MAG: hypothetical protein A2046_03860 [Bacteroidetes bacterium GWA2_30_7]
MKKRFIILFSIFCATICFSQTNKGDILLNISGNGYYNYKDLAQFNISLNPKIGWFVINNFAIGVGTGYSYFYSKQFSSPYSPYISFQNSNTLELGPFLRYYGPIKKHAVFAHICPLFGNSFIKEKNSNSKKYHLSKSQFFNFNIGMGYTYFITKNVGIEILPMFQYYIRRSASGFIVNDTDKDKIKFSGNGSEIISYILEIGIQIHLNKNNDSNEEVKE